MGGIETLNQKLYLVRFRALAFFLVPASLDTWSPHEKRARL